MANRKINFTFKRVCFGKVFCEKFELNSAGSLENLCFQGFPPPPLPPLPFFSCPVCQ
jgi:hypothetical protein